MKTLKTIGAGLAAGALMLSTPVIAQDADAAEEMSEEELEAFSTMMGSMFAAEPLTEDQQARLPQATRIVAQMIPEGTMSEMMGSMFDDIMGPIMAMGGGASSATVVQGLGVTTFDIDLTEEQLAEVASMFDPAWQERNDRQMAVMPTIMGEMMSAMEPPMRKAMSELYAIHFNATELNEIEAFFKTETGTNFARKSFTMASDPRIISASMEALPAMMGGLADIETKMDEATADMAPVRSFAELTPAQQSRIMELTGFTRQQIEDNLAVPATEVTE